MLKKKIGVKTSATGLIRSLIEANWFVSDRMSPAANAPMMRAVPARSARTQSNSRNANADTTSTPRTRIRSTRPNSRGASFSPIHRATKRKTTATPRIRSAPCRLNAVPAGPPVQKAQDERYRDTHHRDRRRGGPHPHHSLEVGLEPDLEQQHHHPDLGEQLKHRCERVGGADRDHLEKTGAERDARQELAHHGRLAQALERLAGEFPGEQHDREHREKASDVDPAGRPDEEGQACGQGPRGQAKAAASPWDGS